MTEPCPLCAGQGEDVLWLDDCCRVILVDDPRYPGFCRVLLNAHVKEMTDLGEMERLRLMAVVLAVEAGLRELLSPAKINLASLGNLVPHVHWHVIPRYADDAHFPDAVWATERRTGAVRSLPKDFKPRLVSRLLDRLGSPAQHLAR